MRGEMDSAVGENLRAGLEHTNRQVGFALTLWAIATAGMARVADPKADSLQPYVLAFLDCHSEWVDEGQPIDGTADLEDNAFLLCGAVADYTGAPAPGGYATNVGHALANLTGNPYTDIADEVTDICGDPDCPCAPGPVTAVGTRPRDEVTEACCPEAELMGGLAGEDFDAAVESLVDMGLAERVDIDGEPGVRLTQAGRLAAVSLDDE